MSRMKLFSAILVILAALQIFASDVYSQKKTVKASPCKLSLPPKGIMQANATFTNRYFLRIDADNKPIKINRVTGFDYIKDEDVKACINGWTFKNFAENAYLVVSVMWLHGRGWEPIKISGKGFSKAVVIQSKE